METPERAAIVQIERSKTIELMEAEHIEKFKAGPLFKQAVLEQWADQLEAYARATIRYQAHLLTRKHPRDESPSVDYDAVLGRGTINAIGQGDSSANYSLQQWKRTQHANCCHGGVAVQVPQDDIRRMVDEAVMQQNLNAAEVEGMVVDA